ncbi:hypothetical protein EDB83DRAFT_2513141 [Lactarius deliciosus]|nr:hypothetical protein EDB83DRAFT_2513141 [Lactarius deliciosus]
MASMSAEERVQAVSQFLLQSPPGEINDMYARSSGMTETLEAGVLPALQQYNLEQFTVAEVPDTGHTVSHLTLRLDHLRLLRDNLSDSALEASTLQYLSSHFNDGTASVFATPNSATRFTVQVVANKYNPVNFCDPAGQDDGVQNTSSTSTKRKITGRILVNVHYYEQGNVQLETKHNASIALPASVTASSPSVSSKKVLALIADQERAYQESLGDTYHEMGEKTFKGLRRALPLTRQKLDWDKVLGYKLGAELSASKGVFGASEGSS